MSDSSNIFNDIIPESFVSLPTPPPYLLSIARSTTESALEQIRRNQEQLQKQLSHQEYLYQNLLNYGLLLNSGNQGSATTSTLSNNLLNLINKRHQFFGGSDDTDSRSSFLPLGSIFAGFGSVFEKLFGTRFWFYSLVIVFVCILLLLVVCFCMYCCCCTPLGRFCCKCPTFGSCFKTKKKSTGSNKFGFGTSKKIEEKNKLRCCV